MMRMIFMIYYCALYYLLVLCSSLDVNERSMDVLQTLLRHNKFIDSLILSPKSDYSRLFLPVSSFLPTDAHHYTKISLEFNLKLNPDYSHNMVLFNIVNNSHNNSLILLLSESDVNENCYHVHISYTAHSKVDEVSSHRCFIMKRETSFSVTMLMDKNEIKFETSKENSENLRLNNAVFKDVILQKDDIIWLFNEPKKYFGRLYGSVYKIVLKMKTSSIGCNDEDENQIIISRKKKSLSSMERKSKKYADLREFLMEKYKVNCSVLKNIRFNSNLEGDPGELGDKGNSGPKGLKGNPGSRGMCDLESCKSKGRIKGEKGDKGTCNAFSCPSVIGPKGQMGEPGIRGFKGNKGESATVDVELVKQMTLSIVKNQLRQKNMVELLRGSKGNPGESCGCKLNDENARFSESRARERRSGSNGQSIQNNIYYKTLNTGYGSLVFKTRSDLNEVAYKLPLGSVVFVVDSDKFLVKIDEINQIWRMISLKSKIWSIPEPRPVPKPTTPMFPYDRKTNSMGFHLVALPLPTTGDLKSNLHEPGGYTGAHFKCQQAGKIYGIAKLMHPLINSNSFNFKYSVNRKYWGNKVYNTRGELLASNVMSLFSPMHILPNEILDFNLNPISESKLSPCIWMGQEVDANRIEDYKFNSRGKCQSWMSRHPQVQGMSVDLSWAKDKKIKRALYSPKNIKETPCSKQCFILCLQSVP